MEREIIADIARRVQKTGRYTETAELMAKAMTEQGYSAAKIQAEVMKLLRADKAYQMAVAENTKAYKQQVQEIINKTLEEINEGNKELIAQAGNMAWNNDLSMWSEHGVSLKKPNSMSQLLSAFRIQTAKELKNLTRSMGFKNTVLGTTGVLNMYQRELDLALLKVASGTFSYDQVVNDCVKRMAKSGLRTVDYASGRSYQLDSAARMAVRTGMAQLSGRVTEMNLKSTGQDLVITSQHMGSRPEHAPIQNKVFSYSGKNKKYPSFKAPLGSGGAGYGMGDGIQGPNCSHNFYPYWEDDPIPEDIPYDESYYQNTQKQRAMERNIRATKREIEAQKAIGGDVKELNRKLRKQVSDYHSFSDSVGIRAKDNRLRVSGGTSDLRKTKSYKTAIVKQKSKAGSINNANYPFNENASFAMKIAGIDSDVCKKLQHISKEIVKNGAETGKEYAYALDRVSGKTLAYEEGLVGECMSQEFFKKLLNCGENSVILLHNHTNNKGASYIDVNTALFDQRIYASIMSCNDGSVYYMANKKKVPGAHNIYDLVFDMDAEIVDNELKKLPDYNKIKENIGSLASAKEEVIARMIIREYFNEVQ